MAKLQLNLDVYNGFPLRGRIMWKGSLKSLENPTKDRLFHSVSLHLPPVNLTTILAINETIKLAEIHKY